MIDYLVYQFQITLLWYCTKCWERDWFVPKHRIGVSIIRKVLSEDNDKEILELKEYFENDSQSAECHEAGGIQMVYTNK